MADFKSKPKRKYKKRGSTPDSTKQSISRSLAEYWKSPPGIRRRHELAERLRIHKQK
jgi:hypothetical protein